MLVVGLEDVSFQKDGVTYYGKRIHTTFQKDGCVGDAVECFYCSSKVDGVSQVKIGDLIDISYNRYGKVNRIIFDN